MTATIPSIPAAKPAAKPAADKVSRLNTISAKRVIEPETEFTGKIGDGQVIPDELLSIAGLGLVDQLTAEQKAALSREEIASIANAGVRFEAVLTAGFALQVVTTPDLVDPRVTYLFHEIGEESRHSRLFIHMIDQLAPKTENPLRNKLLTAIERRGILHIIKRPALLYTLVLGGEEIPDLFQKLAGEHPDTDPYIQQVNKYHRMEEARHLSFARTVLPEVWERATMSDRLAVKFVAPLLIQGMFDTIVHPGVYAAAGLPTWKTWKAAKAAPERVALRHQATRPVVRTLIDGGVLRAGHVPPGWRRLCGIDRHGDPVTA
ncbi:MAG: diiron oxygenase [Acidimicrobiales bacterium]